MYIYEMNNELEEFYVKRPRHCVPYAVVFYRLIQESPPEPLAAEAISKVLKIFVPSINIFVCTNNQ